MDIKELRKEIDAVDGELLRLFLRRMELSAEIAAVKKAEGRPVFDPERETQKLSRIASASGAMGEYALDLWEKLMELSRKYQFSLDRDEVE